MDPRGCLLRVNKNQYAEPALTALLQREQVSEDITETPFSLVSEYAETLPVRH